MKHMSPDASGFRRPPNQFGTLQFDDGDRPPPFYRYFIPEPQVLSMLKDATCFARITLARDIDERELNHLLYYSPTMMSYRSFVTYAGRMLLIFSRNREEQAMQFADVMGYLQETQPVDEQKSMRGLGREDLEYGGRIVLNVHDDRVVELCDEMQMPW